MFPPDSSLEALQAWFGRAISRPLSREYRGNPLAKSAPELAAEGDAIIRGRGGVSGSERAGIYNEQYWFRLLTIMQEEYACAVHVLGLEAYNDWAIRYLAAHPPASPYLSHLDAEWPGFMAREYRQSRPGRDPDPEAVLQALAYDRAFSRAFDAPDGRPPQPPQAMGLAPHASVVRLTFDFPAFRSLCLADESLAREIPLGPGGSPMIIWRGKDLILWQKPLSEAACKVLEALREPATLPEAFARLEDSLTPQEEDELVANLTEWCAEWTREGILCRA